MISIPCEIARHNFNDVTLSRVPMLRTVLITTALVSCIQPDEPELGSTEQLGVCPIGMCGGNSPLLGPHKAEELNEKGVENSAKIKLLGYIKAGSTCSTSRPCKVDVVGRQMFVRDIYGGTFTGSTLAGGYLSVWQPGDSNFAPPLPAGNARIWLDSYSTNAKFWQSPYEPLESYGLSYEVPGITRGPLCLSPPNVVDNEGNPWLSRFEAFFFTGDRYDHDKMTVTASTMAEAGDWFNIACAGSATAKLLLNRHTTAGALGSSLNPTRAQRQTMLKMYTGDFCGTGTTYTVQGTKISWGKVGGGLAGPSVTGINSVESFWTENGAICMDRHRLASSQNTAEAALEGMVRNGYLASPPTCRQMPKCSELPTSTLTGTYLWTASAALP